jgi:hypothetical protein
MSELGFDIHEVMQDPDTQQPQEIEKLLETPLEEFEISVRAFNLLNHSKMHLLKDVVCAESPHHFLKYRNFGKKSFMEIETMLYNLGLKWRFVDVMPPAPASPTTRERQLVVLHMNYALNNFAWPQIIIEAFEKHDIKTIGDLLASREVLLNLPTMLAKDFDFIDTRIKQWKVKW